MFPYRLLAFSFALIALAPFSAADTLTVGPTGQFSEIQAAIDAAQDDDVILVQAGTYQAIVVDKPLRILGAGPGSVTIAFDGSFDGSGVIVRDIGAGEELVLSAVSVSSPPGYARVLLQNCPGTVVLQDVVVRNLREDAPVALNFDNCARVVLLDSRVVGGGGFNFEFGAFELGGAAVRAQDSTLWISNSEIVGLTDGEFSAGPGVHLVRSTLHAWRTSIHGGSFGGQLCAECGDAGGPGILAVGSTVNLFGGPDSSVLGGQGSLGFGPFGEFLYPGGPGLSLTGSSHARIQADVPVRGGWNGNRTVRAPAVSVDGTSSFTLDPKVFPTLVSSAPQVPVGSSFDLTLEGNPGGYQVLYLSLRTGPTSSHRGVDGFGLLDTAQLFKFVSEVLPASGALAVTVHVPSTPALIGSTFFFQNVERFPNSFALRQITPANRFAIGNPVLVTIMP